MSGDINSNTSKKIDNYAKSHIDELRSQEFISKRDITKYDIAKEMLSKGLLNEEEFYLWNDTQEGRDSFSISSQSIFTCTSNTFDNGSYLDNLAMTINKGDVFESSKPKTRRQGDRGKDTRVYSADILSQLAEKAQEMLKQYHNSIGYVSFDAVDQGIKVIGDLTWDALTDRNDYVTVFENEEAIENELITLAQLKNLAGNPEKFNTKFKEFYGIDYDEAAFERLTNADAKLKILNSYEYLSNQLSDQINRLDDIDPQALQTAAIAFVSPLFGNDMNMAGRFVKNLKTQSKNDIEFKQKLKDTLSSAWANITIAMSSMNREEIEADYKSAYKDAMGDYKSDDVCENYIANSKMSASVIEIGTIIAGTFIFGTSGTVANLTNRAVAAFGPKLGPQIMKAGMTLTTASLPAVETTVGELTRPTIITEGFTEGWSDKAWEELKNGMMYGAFGAYVSGPLGNLVSKVLSKNPQLFTQILANSKFSIAGTAVETSADVLFDRITSDLSFKESLAQNGIMNFGMMFAGARIHSSAGKGGQIPDVDISDVKIEKMRDGSYNLKANGQVFYKAKNDNELAVAVLALGGRQEAKLNGEENTGIDVYSAISTNPAENITPRLVEQVYMNEYKDEGMRLNTPEKLEAELKDADPHAENVEALSIVASGKSKEIMSQRYSEMAKILDEIHVNYANEIKQLEKQYGRKPQQFAEHFMSFLADKMGVSGCEPDIVFKEIKEGDGNYNWSTGQLCISDKIRDCNGIKTIIAHEFIHTLQFENILSAYGKQGVVEIYMKHNNGKLIEGLTKKYVKDEYGLDIEELGLTNDELSALQQQVAEAWADNCLSSDANLRLLNYAQEHPAQQGSLNSYMARLQLDNLIKLEEFDTEAYFRSTIESEAYFLGNGQINGRKRNIGRFEQNVSGHNEIESGITIPMGKLENDSPGLAVKLKNAFKKQKFLLNHITKGDTCNKVQRKFIDDVLAENPDINLNYVNKLLSLLDSDVILGKKFAMSPELYNAAVSLAAKSSNNCSEYMFNELLNTAKFSENMDEFKLFISKLADSNLSDIQISALICKQEMSPEKYPVHFVNDFIDKFEQMHLWNTISDIIPELSKLKPEQLYNIADIIISSKKPFYLNEQLIDVKKNMLTTIESLPQDIRETFIKHGIKLDDLEAKLKVQTKVKGYDIKTERESQSRFLKSIIANNNSKAEDILSGDLMADFIKQNQKGLPLEYSRKEFVQDLNNLIEQLPAQERQKVLSDLNITLSADDFNGFINPINLNENNFSSNSKDIINGIKNTAVKFVFKNGVQTSNPEFKAVLDDLIQGFPEFMSIVGKQNGDQSNTLDIHTLEVLHDVILNPEYKGLSDKDKTVLKFAVLMHDFGKRAGIHDNGAHASNSAVFANSILDKFKLPADIKERIVNLVRHHHFSQFSPEDFNRFFRTKEDEVIAKIMAQADYKSSVGGELDVSKFQTTWQQWGTPVVNPVNPQKYFPKAKFNIDGKIVEVPVLNLNDLKAGADMGIYGYEKGTKVDDIVVQVHNTKSASNLENIFQMYEDPNNDYVLSTSIKAINRTNNGYGKYGVTLRTQPMNRGGGGLNDLSNVRWFRKTIGDFFAEQEQHSVSFERGRFYDNYFNTIQYPSQIKDSALREKFHKYQQEFKPNGPGINELFALRPRVGEILVHMDISTQEIPVEIVKLAEKYGVPIIVTGSER